IRDFHVTGVQTCALPIYPERDRGSGGGHGTDLGDDQNVVQRAQRLADEAVDEAVAVEVGGVHVVDTEVERTAQQGDGRGTIVVQALQLHRAVSDARDGASGQQAGASGARSGGSGGGRFGGHGFLLSWGYLIL